MALWHATVGGHDLDIILIAKDSCVREFFKLVRMTIQIWALELGEDVNNSGFLRNTFDYHNTSMRLWAATDALFYDKKFDPIREVEEITGCTLDIFVFPADWREHLGYLQNALPHSDPEFMENIARDARRIHV